MFYSEKIEGLIFSMHPFHYSLKNELGMVDCAHHPSTWEAMAEESFTLALAKSELQNSLGCMNLCLKILTETGAWRCTLVILAFSWLKQEDFELEANLGNPAR